MAPTWDYVQALELADPKGPDLMRYGTDSVWEAVEDLCSRRDKLRCAIFSIALVSALVESLFSKMEYNQNKRRSSLSDKMMSAILHVRDAVVGDPMQPLTFKLEAEDARDVHH